MTDRLTRAELARENEAAHDALDALGVDRGDERGAWPLAERIRRLADARLVVAAAIAFVNDAPNTEQLETLINAVEVYQRQEATELR